MAMSGLRRIVLIRHGETVGNSAERLHGSAELALSAEGLAQRRRAAAMLRTEVFDLVVANQGSVSVTWMRGTGAGGFVSSGSVAAVVRPNWIDVVDANGDDIPDVVVADGNGNWNTTSVFLGNGLGGFVALGRLAR